MHRIDNIEQIINIAKLVDMVWNIGKHKDHLLESLRSMIKKQPSKYYPLSFEQGLIVEQCNLPLLDMPDITKLVRSLVEKNYGPMPIWDIYPIMQYLPLQYEIVCIYNMRSETGWISIPSLKLHWETRMYDMFVPNDGSFKRFVSYLLNNNEYFRIHVPSGSVI